MRHQNASAWLCMFILQTFRLFSFLSEVKMNKHNKKKRKGFNASSMRCPYCGGTVVYRSADGIYHDNSKGMMLYVCSNYPECDSYVRVHAGTNIPVGSLANHELRSLRRTAHHYFDSCTNQASCRSRMRISGSPI